jgi:hypothetical protein
LISALFWDLRFCRGPALLIRPAASLPLLAGYGFIG